MAFPARGPQCELDADLCAQGIVLGGAHVGLRDPHFAISYQSSPPISSIGLRSAKRAASRGNFRHKRFHGIGAVVRSSRTFSHDIHRTGGDAIACIALAAPSVLAR